MSAPSAKAWMDRLAHDLRGPLSPMQTAVYLLRDPGLGNEQREELFAVLERQIQRLGGMIDEFSDLGRAEQGRLKVRSEPIDLELLVMDTVARLREVPPRVEFAGDARTLRIDGDVQRVAQLFHALLGLQLSRSSPVAVQARIECHDNRLRMVCTVHCRDASDALIASLLTAPHPDPPDDALGLGLVIAAAIADAHGGGLHGRASGDDTLELVLELPAAP
ncbi:HAMP domain-containing histidine kinase [Luteimonas sp. MC1572]|uniref:sensor histidine kinase n=1 Tax=Luteimonas sp. MC1572 TaxID=2799325 RepID=UPI0018F0B238|nr:HAMP domain-containing histidine kinase [Luteimonas sp. MC1572]MBJ6982773.1 HAMP domain-containing histidine kinase [Luteimonas sp. MC1572]QQO04009.1 HAMP domain-containing histidine kinase [Luteimonas sp. MC1572]